MKYELFRILWVDSCGKDGWMAKEEAVHRNLNIESIGYVISQVLFETMVIDNI